MTIPEPTTPLDNSPAPDVAPDAAPSPKPFDQPPVGSEPAPVPDSAPAPVADAAPVEAKPFYSSLPEDWRNQVVSGLKLEDADAEKMNKFLGKFNDINSAFKSAWHGDQKIRAGQLSSGLPENPTEQELTDWREANDVPMSADAYDVALDDGLILGDEDRAIMENVYQVALDNNIAKGAMSGLVNAFLKGREAEVDAIATQDNLDSQTATQQLRDMWGPSDYQTNINMINGLLNQVPESVRDLFLTARLGDGQGLFNSPEMTVFFADVARKLNPAGTVVPNSNNPGQAIADEIKALEARMGTKEWFKDPEAQARYQQLVNAKEGMQQG